MNRTKDKDFTKLQTRLRIGDWDAEISGAFTARVLAALPPSPANITGAEADYCPILVTKNKTRASLELARLRAVSECASSDSNLPIVIFAHFLTKRLARALTTLEKSYLVGLPDSDFNKAAPFLALYPGALFMITDNLNVDCGLGQGTRCRLLCAPQFPPGTTYSVVIFHGIRVRVPSADPLFVLVELTSTRLITQPHGQPPNLPTNVVALPMHLHRKVVVDISGIPENNRKSVSVKVRQLPLRAANVLTSYSVQSGQFNRIIIYETTPTEFYTQVSRCSGGLQSIALARPLAPRFKPAAPDSTIEEVARLKILHTSTARAFNLEISRTIRSTPKLLGAQTSRPEAPTAPKTMDPRNSTPAPPLLPTPPPPPPTPPALPFAQGLVGLLNLGNTCYINCILQSLISLPALRNHYLTGAFMRHLPPHGQIIPPFPPFDNSFIPAAHIIASGNLRVLAVSFRNVLRGMWSSATSPDDIRGNLDLFFRSFCACHQGFATSYAFYICCALCSFKTNISATGFSGHNMHDAQEFASFLIDSLHEGGKVPPSFHIPSSSSVIQHLFGGSMTSKITCATCGHSSTAIDPFSIITLPLPPGDGACTVSEIIDHYFAEETLTGNEVAICSHCEKRTATKKKISLETFPSILILHLKRFKSNGTPRCNPVTFPLTDFRLQPSSTRSSAVYDCAAFVHYHNAHYTTFARRGNASAWYCFNDSNITVVPSAANISDNNTQVYIAFYVMRG